MISFSVVPEVYEAPEVVEVKLLSEEEEAGSSYDPPNDLAQEFTSLAPETLNEAGCNCFYQTIWSASNCHFRVSGPW